MTRKRKPRKRGATKLAKTKLALAAKIVMEVAHRLEDEFKLPRGVIELRIRGDI
jgi:hypothetical protein